MTDQTARTAIITGGLSGIGLEVARTLAMAGHRVAIGARRGGDTALQDRTRDMTHGDVYVGALDVRDAASVDGFCEAVQQEMGPPSILVNAAGIEHNHTVSGHALQAWQDVIETNLTGTFLMTRACLPGMIAGGWGRIVNIASTAAHTAQPDQAAYCASKAGVLGLTRAVALEGAPHGVTCTAISPTWVETDMLRDHARAMARETGRPVEEEIAEIARANPQNRLVQPSEIAALVAFLCSDAAPALTMEDIQINAGALW